MRAVAAVTYVLTWPKPRSMSIRLPENWRPGLESNQAWKTMHGFCVATPPPGRPQEYGRRP